MPVSLSVVWMAVRASLRRVLEQVTLAELAAGRLPEHVRLLAEEYSSSWDAPAAPGDPAGGRASR